MDDLKNRAGEKLGALQEAAITAADSSKSRVQDAVTQTSEAIRKLREAFLELWHNDLFAESRARAGVWARDALQRVKDGAPPLSPAVLYHELKALFKDRVWRRSMLIFACGVMAGGCAGLAAGLRAGTAVPAGPHARALHAHDDQTVLLVEDAVTPGARAGEVLVRVQAFSVCVCDRCVLRGRASTLRALLQRTHLTLGRAFAGVVLDVGAGVSELELGDEVWGCLSEWSGGTASELLTLRSTRVSKRPRSLAADAAASLPWGGALALSALQTLRLTPHNTKGKRVVVCGAGSGEGCALVQVLSAWGAHVTVLAPRHAALTLQDLGASEFIDVESLSERAPGSWGAVEAAAARSGPWDAVLACPGVGCPPGPPTNRAAILKATASRRSVVDLRPHALVTDRLPTPFAFVFAVSFYSFRVLRWMCGCGFHTDWLEDEFTLSAGLDTLARLVDAGTLAPVLDKVYLPQDFENALAHACSEDAIGTTVIRFP